MERPTKQAKSNTSHNSTTPHLAELIHQEKWSEVIIRLQTNPEEATIKGPIWEDGPIGLPLHLACENSAPPDVVKELIRVHPDAAQTADSRGRLPAHWLFVADNIIISTEVVQLVLAAHPFAACTADAEGMLPLHHACTLLELELEFLRVILAANPGAACIADKRGKLPLHRAVYYWDYEQERHIKELIAANPDATRVRDNDGSLPLHIACEACDSIGMLRLLIDTNPDATRVRDNDGSLPLHIACEACGSIGMLRLLIDANPDATRVRNNDGSLPLHIACQKIDNIETLRLLIDVNPDALVAVDNDGFDPLYYAWKNMDEEDECNKGATIEFILQKLYEGTKSHTPLFVPRSQYMEMTVGFAGAMANLRRVEKELAEAKKTIQSQAEELAKKQS